jgi:hypothetical protein
MASLKNRRLKIRRSRRPRLDVMNEIWVNIGNSKNRKSAQMGQQDCRSRKLTALSAGNPREYALDALILQE